MAQIQKEERPSRVRNWMKIIGVFLILQCIFIICDMFSWAPNLNDEGISVVNKLSEWKLFAQWFTPYNTVEFNILTAILTVILLPAACISAITDKK
ncbi:hypothetical protein BAMA_16765 [Bacillus manliponensis]|uniref:YfzA-like protein n=1 Tax=Bacillus manliponensis TaxID=574376 RepID=A0A073K0S6_9BACI|nr:YfzA family protein [Bacillus manliponensis]KEK20105.1 hypothetical protein BAMA_16765 [Bacillus manliponensis]